MNSSLIADQYLHDSLLGKQSMACKEYCAEYWFKKESHGKNGYVQWRLAVYNSHNAENGVKYRKSITDFWFQKKSWKEWIWAMATCFHN